MREFNYGMMVELPTDFDTALDEVTSRLSDEGFGVLTEIDVKSTLKKKLDVDFPRYRILGACNPKLAYEAMTAEPNIGLLLPCNVVVSEIDEDHTRVTAMDPQPVLALVDNQAVEPIAKTVRMKMQSVLANLEQAVKARG
jgi:uncharacterized protein (DUF302 family)